MHDRILSALFAGLFAAGLTASTVAQAAPPPAGAKYVAMGSSYAAGTSLKAKAVDSPANCGQGTDSYPRQVARALGLRLVDRSCGGAVTRDVLLGGQYGLPPQIDAVDADTRLVTITIGGNDVRFVADLGLFSCRHRLQEVPEAGRQYSCVAAPDFSEEAAFAALEPNLREIAQKVRQRAPQARLLFIDYITVVPDAGTCADLALSEDEATALRSRARRLAALTARVAAENGADIIQASALSHGHDVCSKQPWAWGFVPNYNPATAQSVPFHPRLEGTTAIAQAILARLK